MTIITQRIQLILGERGMTQADLATRSGISRQSVSTILTRGTAAPKNVYRLARALGVDPAEIVAEKGE